jgi:hypothetical protein
MIIIIYMIVGFCLEFLQISLISWSLGILLYHYHLANLEKKKTFQIGDNYLQNQPLVVLISGLIASAIAMLVYQTKPSLGIHQTVAIGLMTIINSWMVLKLTFKCWGYWRSLIFSTFLAWLGLFLGYLAQNFL